MPKILIVDDDYKFSEFAKMLLESVDYSAVICDDSRQVLSMAVQEKPDLVLMDISMPEVNGIEATRHLRSDPATKSLPIILCSITIHSDEMPEVEACGADLFLAKPLKRDQLKGEIDRILGRRGDDR